MKFPNFRCTVTLLQSSFVYMLLFYRRFQKWFICHVVLLTLLTFCQLENREPAEIITVYPVRNLKACNKLFQKFTRQPLQSISLKTTS